MNSKSQLPPAPLLVPDSSSSDAKLALANTEKPRSALVVIGRKVRSRDKAKKTRRRIAEVEKVLQAMACLLELSPNPQLIQGIAIALRDCGRRVRGLRKRNRP